MLHDFIKKSQKTPAHELDVAVKRVIAFQLASVMEEKGITKVEMAKQLKTSRSQIDRLLDPENDKVTLVKVTRRVTCSRLLDPENNKVTLATLSRAAKVVGRELTLELR